MIDNAATLGWAGSNPDPLAERDLISPKEVGNFVADLIGWRQQRKDWDCYEPINDKKPYEKKVFGTEPVYCAPQTKLCSPDIKGLLDNTS